MKTQTPVRKLLLTLAGASFLASLSLHIQAQTPAPSHTASCKPLESKLTEAESAYYKHDAKKAAPLFAAAYAKDPSDRRSRMLEIDSLLDQDKKDDARKKADAWVASDPKDAYALLTAAKLRRDRGDLLEFYALTLKAIAADACIPETYEALTAFESLAGYRATAKRHIIIAHQLAPNNPEIRSAWIGFLEEAQQIEEAKKFVAESELFTEKERAAAVKRFDRSIAFSENRCQIASVKGPAVIPMVPIYGPMGPLAWGLEIGFNGHKRTLQIDTGASGFTMTRSAGASIGLPSAGKSHVGGFGDSGASGIDLSRADTVQIGGLEFHGCIVDVLAMNGVMGGSLMQGNRLDNIDGLVGTDVFARYIVTVDYIKHEIRLAPLPQSPSETVPGEKLDALGGRTDRDWMLVDRYVDPSMKTWTRVYRRGHLILMPTKLTNEGKPGINGLFAVDTGSFTNILDVATAKELTTSDYSSTRIRGLGGVSAMSLAGKFTADFAGLRLPVKSMDALDLSRFGEVAGFLGYPTLEQLVMHIDYRDNLVFFEAPNAIKK